MKSYYLFSNQILIVFFLLIFNILSPYFSIHYLVNSVISSTSEENNTLSQKKPNDPSESSNDNNKITIDLVNKIRKNDDRNKNALIQHLKFKNPGNDFYLSKLNPVTTFDLFESIFTTPIRRNSFHGTPTDLNDKKNDPNAIVLEIPSNIRTFLLRKFVKENNFVDFLKLREYESLIPIDVVSYYESLLEKLYDINDELDNIGSDHPFVSNKDITTQTTSSNTEDNKNSKFSDRLNYISSPFYKFATCLEKKNRAECAIFDFLDKCEFKYDSSNQEVTFHHPPIDKIKSISINDNDENPPIKNVNLIPVYSSNDSSNDNISTIVTSEENIDDNKSREYKIDNIIVSNIPIINEPPLSFKDRLNQIFCCSKSRTASMISKVKSESRKNVKDVSTNNPNFDENEFIFEIPRIVITKPEQHQQPSMSTQFVNKNEQKDDVIGLRMLKDGQIETVSPNINEENLSNVINKSNEDNLLTLKSDQFVSYDEYIKNKVGESSGNVKLSDTIIEKYNKSINTFNSKLPLSTISEEKSTTDVGSKGKKSIEFNRIKQFRILMDLDPNESGSYYENIKREGVVIDSNKLKQLGSFYKQYLDSIGEDYRHLRSFDELEEFYRQKYRDEFEFHHVPLEGMLPVLYARSDFAGQNDDMFYNVMSRLHNYKFKNGKVFIVSPQILSRNFPGSSNSVPVSSKLDVAGSSNSVPMSSKPDVAGSSNSVPVSSKLNVAGSSNSVPVSSKLDVAGSSNSVPVSSKLDVAGSSNSVPVSSKIDDDHPTPKTREEREEMDSRWGIQTPSRARRQRNQEYTDYYNLPFFEKLRIFVKNYDQHPLPRRPPRSLPLSTLNISDDPIVDRLYSFNSPSSRALPLPPPPRFRGNEVVEDLDMSLVNPDGTSLYMIGSPSLRYDSSRFLSDANNISESGPNRNQFRSLNSDMEYSDVKDKYPKKSFVSFSPEVPDCSSYGFQGLSVSVNDPSNNGSQKLQSEGSGFN